MTYQERYTELFQKYESVTKALHEATQKISFLDGFGDTGELGSYLKAQREYRYVERDFQQLLKYVTSKNLNPTSEYILGDYMYGIIKEDQQNKGTPWKDEELTPSTKGGVRGYESLIGLTNDGEINRMIQGTEYKFPVLNLTHGRECYNYLAKMLQNGGGDGFDVNNLKFDNIDEVKQIYIKVVVTIWL